MLWTSWRRKNRTRLSCMTKTTNISPCFAVDIHISQRCVVLEVGFSRSCGQSFLNTNVYVNMLTKAMNSTKGAFPKQIARNRKCPCPFSIIPTCTSNTPSRDNKYKRHIKPSPNTYGSFSVTFCVCEPLPIFAPQSGQLLDCFSWPHYDKVE